MPVRGVVPVLVTPFDDHGHVDEESLKRLVEFSIKSGVHGLGIGLGSEIHRLNEQERDLVVRTVADQAAKRVPVVVNTSGAGTDLAIFYSIQAVHAGADIVMAAPPAGTGVITVDGIKDYYSSIADSVNAPVMIKDTVSAPVPPGLVRDIVDGSFRLWYCKVETAPTPARIASTIGETGGLVDVLGGAGGNYMVEELRRGSAGTMPGCSMPSAFVQVWNSFQSGDVAEAMSVFKERILPVNRLASYGMDHFFHVHKRILYRRGLIGSAYVRRPAAGLDEVSVKELDEVTERVFHSS